MTAWLAYRKCPVCGVGMGQQCQTLSGAIVNGRPNAALTPKDEPHKNRPARSTRPGTSLARLITKECARRAVAR